jgi:hypothetical protein
MSRQPITFMNVDLPEPDGPITATNSPRRDLERNAGERVHVGLAHPVDLDEVVRLDERAVGHRVA